MNIANQRDIGAQLVAKNAVNPAVVTAGSTDDGQEVNGFIIDRQAFADLLLSVKVAIPYDASIVDTFTATLAANLQDSDTTASTAFADYDDKDGSTGQSVVETGTTAVTAFDKILEFDVDLSSAKRYIRLQVTPTLSNGSTSSDTLDYGAVHVFGGSDQPPAD